MKVMGRRKVPASLRQGYDREPGRGEAGFGYFAKVLLERLDRGETVPADMPYPIPRACVIVRGQKIRKIGRDTVAATCFYFSK